MGFLRQEYWSGLPCPLLGNLLKSGVKPWSPALSVDSLPAEPPGKKLFKQSQFRRGISSQSGTRELSGETGQKAKLFCMDMTTGQMSGVGLEAKGPACWSPRLWAGLESPMESISDGGGQRLGAGRCSMTVAFGGHPPRWKSWRRQAALWEALAASQVRGHEGLGWGLQEQRRPSDPCLGSISRPVPVCLRASETTVLSLLSAWRTCSSE